MFLVIKENRITGSFIIVGEFANREKADKFAVRCSFADASSRNRYVVM